MSEILEFGKHAPYIWSSFALTFAVLLLNAWIARGAFRKTLRSIRRTQEGRKS